MQGTHGITAQTPSRLMLDTGVLSVGGVAVGATRGGIEWNLNRTIRTMAADHELGDIKGMKRRESVRPTLSVNGLEMTYDNIKRYIAGSRDRYELADLTLSGVIAGDSVTINNRTYTAVASDPASMQFEVGINDDATTANLTTKLVDANVGVPGVLFAAANNVITITSDPNKFHVEHSANFTLTPTGDAEMTGGKILPSDFASEVTLTGELSSGAEVVITLKNCLAEGDWSLAQNDRDEAVANVTFVAHFDPNTPQSEPWEIEFV